MAGHRDPLAPCARAVLRLPARALLGDGCVQVSKHGQVLLRICLDAGYRTVIDDAWTAMQLSLPHARAHVYRCSGIQAVNVQGSNKLWLRAFPNHGPGRKHERPIVLEPWQQRIVDRHTGEFIRGLIHSDGCRTTNRFTTPSAEWPRSRVRLWSLLLLEPLDGHPRPVLPRLRSARRSLDAVQPAQHLGLAPQERGTTRRARLREGLTLNVHRPSVPLKAAHTEGS
jgi:hypothetical protein